MIVSISPRKRCSAAAAVARSSARACSSPVRRLGLLREPRLDVPQLLFETVATAGDRRELRRELSLPLGQYGRRIRQSRPVLLLFVRQLDLVIVSLARQLLFQADLLGTGALGDRVNLAPEALLRCRRRCTQFRECQLEGRTRLGLLRETRFDVPQLLFETVATAGDRRELRLELSLPLGQQGRRIRQSRPVLLLFVRQLDLVIVSLARQLVFQADLLGTGALGDRVDLAAKALLGGRSACTQIRERLLKGLQDSVCCVSLASTSLSCCSRLSRLPEIAASSVVN